MIAPIPPVRVLESDTLLCPQCRMPWDAHPLECYNKDCEARGQPHCHLFKIVRVVK